MTGIWALLDGAKNQPPPQKISLLGPVQVQSFPAILFLTIIKINKKLYDYTYDWASCNRKVLINIKQHLYLY